MNHASRILVVRLGAMGDVIHTLPAVASLKHSMPASRLSWIIESRWSPLLEGNPYVDEIIPFDRGAPGAWRQCWNSLRAERFDLAVDFQGLIKSAMVASIARAERIYGFKNSRERMAALFYSNRVPVNAPHKVEQNMALAAAAGALHPLQTFPLPQGRPEGVLPAGDFVLASPLAGWGAKQWPTTHYEKLAALLRSELGIRLVLNAPQAVSVPGALTHVSGLSGLVHATRHAAAVVGVDSGPLHLAAALGRAGVAIFGPTDPAINGPRGGSFTVLRSPGAETTYKRTQDPHASMRAVSPEQVLAALRTILVPSGAAVRQ